MQGNQESDQESNDDTYNMFTLRGPSCDPIIIINGIPVDMKLDTGASVSILSEETYQTITGQSDAEPLQESTLRLTTYTGECIPVLGRASVAVRYGEGGT